MHWNKQISIVEIEIDYGEILYKRMSELERDYGTLEYIETIVDSLGGALTLRWYYSETLDLRLAFLDGSDASYDPLCIKLSGTTQQLFGIDSEMTNEEFALTTDSLLRSSVGDDNPYQTQTFNFKYYFGMTSSRGDANYMKLWWNETYMAEIRIEKMEEAFIIHPNSLCSISKVFDLN